MAVLRTLEDGWIVNTTVNPLTYEVLSRRASKRVDPKIQLETTRRLAILRQEKNRPDVVRRVINFFANFGTTVAG